MDRNDRNKSHFFPSFTVYAAFLLVQLLHRNNAITTRTILSRPNNLHPLTFSLSFHGRERKEKMRYFLYHSTCTFFFLSPLRPEEDFLPSLPGAQSETYLQHGRPFSIYAHFYWFIRYFLYLGEKCHFVATNIFPVWKRGICDSSLEFFFFFFLFRKALSLHCEAFLLNMKILEYRMHVSKTWRMNPACNTRYFFLFFRFHKICKRLECLSKRPCISLSLSTEISRAFAEMCDF